MQKQKENNLRQFEKVYYCIVHGKLKKDTRGFITANLIVNNRKIRKDIPKQSIFNKSYAESVEYSVQRENENELKTKKVMRDKEQNKKTKNQSLALGRLSGKK